MKISGIPAIKGCYLFSILFLVTAIRQEISAQASFNGKMLDTARFTALVQRKMDSLHIPGSSISFIYKGKMIYQINHGYSRLEDSVKVDGNTIFEAASMSKPLFAYYVLMLVRRRKIDLDRPLHEYLPLVDLEYDPRYRKITARMVLSHTSGLPNWRAENRGQELDIKFDPGKSFSYSGEGFDYLAKVVCKILRCNLVTLNNQLRSALFIPSGMRQCSMIWEDKYNQTIATGYNYEFLPREKWQPKIVNSASSLLCTSGDYAKFLETLCSQKLLDDKGTAELLKDQVILPSNHVIRAYFGWTSWSLGFAILPTPFGDLYAHGGTNEDFQSNFLLDIRTGTGYVLMTNSDHGHELNKIIEDIMLDRRKL